ncbi:MAG TPA: ROK family protein [Xanthobacteraceae bacterium]|nr:ROK family protein [Xanthobacteraceae bacterium]
MAKATSKKIARESEQELAAQLPFPCHGASVLPDVLVESYNVELRKKRRFVGDRANKKAFAALVEKWRKLVEDKSDEKLHELSFKKLNKKKLEQILLKGDADAAGVVQAAIDDFAERLSDVIERYLEQPDWKKTELIFIGGGMSGSRVGELAVGRAQAILYERKISLKLEVIGSDPDEAGLMGAAFLAPSWIFKGYDAILAADIGGTNMRAGVVELRRSKKSVIEKVKVARSSVWEHAEDDPERTEAVDRLIGRLKRLVGWSKKHKVRLAPFVGIGCPGRIRMDGAIDRGAQNLPGNWEADRFNLPALVSEGVAVMPGQRTAVVMHNDAVVQGLSELPHIGKTRHWAVLTIGTGLGNAKFRMRD